jgi:hypothetical protein
VPAVANFFMSDQTYNLYDYRVYVFNVYSVINSIPDFINFVYILLIFGVVLYSTLVNNNNSKFKGVYYAAATVMGIYGILVFMILVINTTIIMIDMYHGRGNEDFIIPLVWLRALIITVIVGHALPILLTFSFKKYV